MNADIEHGKRSEHSERIEDRLRRALHARADLYDGGPAHPLAAPTALDRWRTPLAAAAAVAAVAAAVTAVAIVGTGGSKDIEPAPAPTGPTGTTGPTGPTGSVSSDPAADTFTGDVDGDGMEDTVRQVDREVRAELSSGGTATQRVARGTTLVGLADVGSDRRVVVIGDRAFRLGDDGAFAGVAFWETPPSVVWVGENDALLTATAHQVDGTDYLTAYAWSGESARLEPTVDRMYCPVPGADPEPCGSGAAFTGDPAGLPELQPGPWESVGVGSGEVAVALPGYDGLTARLEGSATDGEVASGDVQLVVGEARVDVPAGGTPALLQAAFPAGDGVAFAVHQGIGDSTTYTLFRYDGTGLSPVQVEPVAGLDLTGGGPAAGGPYTEVFLSASGGFLSLRSESGVDLYQKAVQWSFEGDRLVGTELGVVCRATIVNALDIPDGWGDCGIG